MALRSLRASLADGAFWAALGLLAPQALWVRARAPRFAPPEGPDRGLAGEGTRPALTLLGVGDSVVAGVGAKRLDEALVAAAAVRLAELLHRPVRWQARGCVGARLGEVVRWLPTDRTDFLLLCAGINDVTAPATVRRWRGDVGRALDRAASLGPRLTVFVGLPPLGSFPLLPWPLRQRLASRARRFEDIAQEAVSNRTRVVYLPLGEGLAPEQFADDGYHPSAPSHGLLGREAAERMAAAWDEGDRGAPAEDCN